MPERNIEVAPPADPGGTFADFVLVWQTGENIVLDFAAITGPPRVAVGLGWSPPRGLCAALVTQTPTPPALGGERVAYGPPPPGPPPLTS